MRYNQKLTTVCQHLQVIDSNGFYNEIVEEYNNNELTLSEALSQAKESTLTMLEDNPNDTQLNKILDYINY